MSTARTHLAGFGTQTAGLAAGGYTGSGVNTTEEFTGGGPATFTVGTD